MQGKPQSLPVATRAWQSLCSRDSVVPEDSGVQPVPCSMLARWPLLQQLGETLENLESKIIRCAFTIATFRSKNKSVITISLSYCGTN